VGKAVFQNVLKTALANTTRVLVTHALHFLPACDYIITLDGSTGTIGECGTYDELVKQDGVFSRFVQEYGGSEEEGKKEEEEAIDDAGLPKAGDQALTKKREAPKEAAIQLMQNEERNTGAVKTGGKVHCHCEHSIIDVSLLHSLQAILPRRKRQGAGTLLVLRDSVYAGG